MRNAGLYRRYYKNDECERGHSPQNFHHWRIIATLKTCLYPICTIRIRVSAILPHSSLVIVLLACRTGIILCFSGECESGARKMRGVSHLQIQEHVFALASCLPPLAWKKEIAMPVTYASFFVFFSDDFVLPSFSITCELWSLGIHHWKCVLREDMIKLLSCDWRISIHFVPLCFSMPLTLKIDGNMNFAVRMLLKGAVMYSVNKNCYRFMVSDAIRWHIYSFGSLL